jgi:m7GpppX diphosphatase
MHSFEQHIKKYSRQASRLIRETPELYCTVVKPYIVSLPANQITW